MSEWGDGLPRDEDGNLDGFSIVGVGDRSREWVARRDDPDCALPARPRSSYPDPIACGWCGTVFCPLQRNKVLYCGPRCCARADYWRDPELSRARRQRYYYANLEKIRAKNRAHSRDYRRQRRARDPAFRAQEAKWAREYRARKKAAAGQ